jgi:hypothetical protein
MIISTKNAFNSSYLSPVTFVFASKPLGRPFVRYSITNRANPSLTPLALIMQFNPAPLYNVGSTLFFPPHYSNPLEDDNEIDSAK